MGKKPRNSAGSRVSSKPQGESDLEDKWVPALCEWLCVEGPCMLRVHVVNGVAVSVEPNIEGKGFKQFTKNRGALCPKAYGLIQKLYNPHRIKGPLKRTNPEKGRGVDPEWVSISWDEAFDVITEKLQKIKAGDTTRLANGGPGLGAMHSSEAWYAFFQAFGPTQWLWGGRSSWCRQSEHTFGNRMHGGLLCEADVEYCNYRIIFGGNSVAAGGTPKNALFAEAKERGMKTVVIDPVLSFTAAKANAWVPIRPCTDTAFLLAMINVIVNELAIYDANFLKHMTNSPYLVKPDGYFMKDKVTQKILVWDSTDQRAKTYDEHIKEFALEGSYEVDQIECKPAFQVLKEHVRQYTPEWASEITDVPSKTIRKIATEYVQNARIGSTIEIDGVKLPYRPVAIEIGRGLNGVMHSYQTILAVHILEALVGSIEVVGGHGGGQLFPYRRLSEDGIIFHVGRFNAGVVPGDDGMNRMHSHSFSWPPITYDAGEVLYPVQGCWPYIEAPFTDPGKLFDRMDHLCWPNLVEAPKGLPIPKAPEMWVRYRTNPFMALGEPKTIEEAIKKIPFIVSISNTIDEVTDYADLVLPEQVELERYILFYDIKMASSRRYHQIALQQPVIEPLHDTMNVNDIMTELAARLSLLDEHNMILNELLDLDEPYRLEPDKKYAWVDVVDRQCKSYTGGTYDLEWFKENGGVARPVRAEEQYEIHLTMKAKKLRYPIPYMEEVKRAGEELARNLGKVGVDWWSTDEYVALPAYFPPILKEVPPEYDFYVTSCRGVMYGWGNNVDMPWMNELAEHVRGFHDIMMNADAAKAKGIKDGDEIWVESEVGKVKRTVTLCQGIRPDCLLISGQFGQWAKPVAKDTGRVSLTALVPMNYRWSDQIIGNQQALVTKAKAYKA